MTVRELVKKGAYVIGSCRNMTEGAIALNDIKQQLSLSTTPLIKGGEAEYLQLDLTSFSSIKKFASEFKKKSKKLDVLILNAGVMMPPFSLTQDGYELQIGTNHIGHFLLFKLLEKMLTKSNQARLVTVSSCAHEGSYESGIDFSKFTTGDGYNAVYAYGQSKLANILFSNEVATRYNNTGLTSNSLHPGMIQTDLMRHINNAIGKNYWLQLLTPFFSLINLACMNADQGALTTLYVATSPDMRGVNGKYFQPVAMLTAPSAHATNTTLQQLLWTETEKITRKHW